MQLSAALLCLTVGVTSALSSSKMSIRSRNGMAKILNAARRIEEAAEEEEEEEFAFLQKYSLKLVGCSAGEVAYNADGNGEYESNAVTVRLCPADSCDSNSMRGCSSGYGDYVVGLNTFVNVFLEEQKKQMEENGEEQEEDDFDINRYSQCEQYEAQDNGDNQDEEGEEAAVYYIGPSCTDDGFDVKLSLFSDEDCSQPSEEDFATVSNGWDLPYSDGGLVSFNCFTCSEYDEDQGAYDTREMCQQIYENSASKCETNMEYYSPNNGQSVEKCDYVESLIPSKASSSANAGKIFGWLVFICVIVGLVGYVMWWRKKKATTAANVDGTMA